MPTQRESSASHLKPSKNVCSNAAGITASITSSQVNLNKGF